MSKCKQKNCSCCQSLTKADAWIGLGAYLAIIAGVFMIIGITHSPVSFLIRGRMVDLMYLLTLLMGTTFLLLAISTTSKLVSYYHTYAPWSIQLGALTLYLLVPMAHVRFLLTGKNALVLPIGMARELSAKKIAKAISASYFAKATSADDPHILVATAIGDIDVLIRCTKPELYLYHLLDEDSKLAGIQFPQKIGDWQIEISDGNAAAVCILQYYPGCNAEEELGKLTIELIDQLVDFGKEI